MWLHSSVGRASHRYRGGHPFETRWSPNLFRLFLSNCLNWKIYCDDHSLLSCREFGWKRSRVTLKCTKWGHFSCVALCSFTTCLSSRGNLTLVLVCHRTVSMAAFYHVGRIVLKPINVNPGLNFKWSTKCSCLKMFFTSYVWCNLRLLKGKQYKQSTSPKSYKTEMKI